MKGTINVPLCVQMCLFFYHFCHENFALSEEKKETLISYFHFSFSPCVSVSSSFYISQVSVGTRQTWSFGANRSAKTSSPLRSPRLSWSWCGRPYRTSHSSSWRPPPSSPSASLSTSLLERTQNVRMGGRGWWGGRFEKVSEEASKTKCFRGEAGCEKPWNDKT